MFCALQVPVMSWFDDMTDRELLNLIPFFEALAGIDDVYTFLGTVDQLPPNHTIAADSLPMPATVNYTTDTIVSPMPTVLHNNIDSDGQLDHEMSTTHDRVCSQE